MELAQRQPDGATLREHLQTAARQGHVDERLTAAPLPQCVRPVWDMFQMLCLSRRSGFAAHSLTMTDIEAWCRLTGTRLTPWELATIVLLDAATLRHVAKHSQAKS